MLATAKATRPLKAAPLCSALALATALAAPATAQTVPSFNAGDPTVTSGTVTFDRGITTPGTEVYTIGSATAVLDFTPTDTATGGGAINFQNAGTTAIFQNTPGGPAFTVLNRIVPADPSRPIAFNGNVVSQLQTAAGAISRGGTTWFYSPGGLVIGDGAVFDVGNLLLSTGDPTGGSGTIGSTSTFTLNSTPNGGGIVNILSGATINAVNPGSYVALVAPVVFQSGNVNVNGAAAYVAAEQATLNFDGLFDITVPVGSSSAGGFPLQHRGTTRFLDTAVQSTAYLVSVPKNDAVTAIVGATASLGFDVATTVGVDNGTVVLSAGYNVVDVSPTTRVSATRADLLVEGGADFIARVNARVTDQADIIAGTGTRFAGRLDLTAARATLTGAAGDEVLTVGGALSVSSNPGSAGNFVFGGIATPAGSVLVNVNGALSTGDINSAIDVSVVAGGTLATGGITAGGDIDAGAAGAITLGALSAGHGVFVESDSGISPISIASIVSGTNPTTSPTDYGDVDILTGGAIDIGDIVGVAITIGPEPTPSAPAAFGDITLGNITGEAVTVAGAGNVTTENISATERDAGGNPEDGFGVFIGASANVVTLDILALDDVEIDAGGDGTSAGSVTTGNLTSINASVDVDTEDGVSSILIGDVRAGDSIELGAGGNLTTGSLTALTNPAVLLTGNGVGLVEVTANGDIRLGDVTGLDIDIDGTDEGGPPPFGNIVTGTLTGEFIEVTSGGTANIAGMVTRELYAGSPDADANRYVAEIGALGNLTVGTISSLGLTALASLNGSVTAGAVTTPSSLIAAGRTGVSLASASTGRGPNDSLFIANSSMLETSPAFAVLLADNEPVGAFNPAILTTLTPVRVGGAVSVPGAIYTGNLIAAATGALDLGPIDAATQIRLDSGAAITLGNVTTPAGLNLKSDGNITTGAITGEEADLTSVNGSIQTGDITVQDGIALAALAPGAGIRTGQLTTDTDDITIFAGGVVSIAGARTIGVDDPEDDIGIGIIAGAGLTIGAVDSAGTIGMLSRTGGIAAGALTARAGGVLLLAAGNVSTGAVTTPADSAFYIGNARQFATDFDPIEDDFDPAPVLAMTPVRVGGGITVAGPVFTGTFRAAASSSITAQEVTAANLFYADAGAGITTRAIAAGTSAYASGTGTVRIAGATVATGRLTVDTTGSVALGNITTGTDTLAIATGGRIDTGTITAIGSIALLADTGITTGALSGSRAGGGFVYLARTTNRSRLGDGTAFLPTFVDGGVSDTMAGAIIVAGPISGGFVRTTASGGQRFLGPIDASARVRLFDSAQTFGGSVTAPVIELIADDVSFARGIAVGGDATSTISIADFGESTVTLGGNGDGATGFTLDAAEIAQLRAGSISIDSVSAEVVVRDFTINGAAVGATANVTAADGAFTINGGDIFVTGNVRMNNATPTNALVFNAEEDFDLLTDTGSIGVFGAGDELGGRLSITGRAIAVADAALFELAENLDFEDDVDPAEVIAAIGAPAARSRPEGFIQAGRLDLAASDTIFVQNSGTASVAGGFTAGSGGMGITSLTENDGDLSDPEDPDLGLAFVIFGRVADGNGGFAVNDATRALISFASNRENADPLSDFFPFSVVNGCQIISAACGGGGGSVQEIAVVSIGTDVQGIVDGALSAASEDGVAAVPDVRLTAVIDSAALITDAIVTDPVASAGNPSLRDEAPAGTEASRGSDDEERKRRDAGKGAEK